VVVDVVVEPCPVLVDVVVVPLELDDVVAPLPALALVEPESVLMAFANSHEKPV
jgi:hypothetical protein